MSEVPITPPPGSEGQQPASTETPIDIAKSTLESLVGNVEVGSPEFMAFWDNADIVYYNTVTEVYMGRGSEDINPTGQSLLRSQELVMERISQRSSEKPGYRKAFEDQAAVLKPLVDREPVRTSNLLREIKTAIATK